VYGTTKSEVTKDPTAVLDAQALSSGARRARAVEGKELNNNKALIQEYLSALSGRTKPAEAVAKYVSDEKLTRHIAETEAAFPRHELIPLQVLCEGEMVVVRGEFRGFHQGPFAGIDATERYVRAELIVIYEVAEQKIANHWMRFDTISLLNQLRVDYLTAASKK
jgi:predicted ester cyclase